MGNERFNTQNEDDDEVTPDTGYKPPIPFRRIPKNTPLPQVEVARDEVIVPLGPPLREQFGLMPEKPKAETEDDEDEDDEDDESSSSSAKQATAAPTTTQPADKESESKPVVIEEHREADAETPVIEDDDAGNTADVPTQTLPAAPVAAPHIPRQRQGEVAYAAPVEPLSEGVQTEQPPQLWAQANEYQAAADVSPRDIWGTEVPLSAEAGQAAVDEARDQEPVRASGAPPTPPIKPPSPSEAYGFAQPPEHDPAVMPNSGRTNYGPALPSFEAAEQYVAASRREYTRPVEARDRRVVPLVVGGLLFERALRKRADRQLEKRMDELSKRRHEDVLRRQDTLTEQQQHFNREQYRQNAELQRLQEVRERFQAPLSYGSEQVAPVPRSYERANRPVVAEQQPLPPVTPAERPAAPATQEEMPAGNEQQYNLLQPHQHVEQDAWRRYVVDEHGREVVGAMTYGEAYHQERQQEVRKDPAADTLANGRPVNASAAASVGGVVMHGPQGAYQQYGSLPSGMTTPSLPAGQLNHIDPQHQLPAKNPMRSNIANPWFWLMLALIVAAFFTAALI